MFETLIQYPMSVDYCLAMIHAVQTTTREFPLTLSGDDLRSYLTKYRRKDENVFIPDEEIPTRIRFERVDFSDLKDTPDGVKGSIFVGRMTLEWLGPRSTLDRESGPARVQIDQYKVCFFRGDIYGINAVTAGSMEFKWMRDGFPDRLNGPQTIKLHRFKMDRINHQFQNPRLEDYHRDLGIRWSPVRNGRVLKPEVFRDIAKKEKLTITMLAVHHSIFADTMVEYLFWEEVNMREQDGQAVYA